jgi:hypothetical protein
MELMELLEDATAAATRPFPAGNRHEPEAPDARTPSPATGVCRACGTSNDRDARFCKNCGARIA